jgi:hypothetical protein
MPLNPAPYKIWEFDLSVARRDEPLGLSGTDIIIFKLTNPVQIRLDDIRNDQIPLTSCDPISPINIVGIPFKEIYLTNEAKRGVLQIIVTFGGTSNQIVEELRKPRGLDRILNKFGVI